MSPPVRIDFLSHCSDGDFFSTRAPKAKFRTALREFRDLLSDESSTGFDLFRSKMETAVHLVVNDAVGGNVPTFDVALNVLDSLSRHFQAVRDETAKAYLRTIRWGITGFQVFKSMDATSRLGGNLNHNHATIANCVKDHWSVIAYVQMEMIVCCLEWLHGALVAWNATQEDARASRASASEQSSVADPTERPSTPNVPTEPPTPQYTIDPSTHNITAPPTASSGLPRAPPPSTSTLEQMLSSLSTGPLPLPSGQTSFSGGPTSTVGRSSPSTSRIVSSPSTSRIVSSIESPFDEASRLSAARDGQAAYPPTFNAPSPFRMSSPLLSKLATDVLKELRTRSCLGMKPRHYAKCKRENWCTSASCSYGHTKEELKIIGIARAIARGGMWKTSVCDKSPKCPYGIGCDYLHDDDKRETIHAIKSHASQLVDHTYVTDGQLYIEFYNGETVTIAT
ncbi:hypothetical protein SPRG_08911 [Saprolegnia parasitica CBS 223.65]|uniref:C3H1-type domain-containing protein n=1 Tax=Saprolegnia parasitica (strain CBS 223.65) TaxID=695850 RepID=A0A067CFN2_SAPPC|nr:hypothetical protein SPRG_08911 [Saprolegnia parasitica CBS 223.65]KDO25612.1 hypothetical protein SPRG_08911 [Saprolegnia parasitica CBS 223.65]|eukprot:XP_012203645.1 hypothetical protein SPRG_08911 [Saprolegnia parasitica CBS 223.65]